MSNIRIEAELSADALLAALTQLSTEDLNRFVQRALLLQAQRRAPSLTSSESDLILRINEPLAAGVRTRFDELVARRRAETLTADEHQELLALTDTIENFEAQRIKYLAELASLRQVSLAALVDQLGIRPPAGG